MDTLLQDVRYAVRVLLKKPGFTFVAVITLALGIGANAAIFTAVDAALLRPFPYRDPAALVHVWQTSPRSEFSEHEAAYPDYLDWRAQSSSFEEMAGYNASMAIFSGHGRAERIAAPRVTSSFFPLLGVQAGLGRVFREGEDQPGSPRVVLLSHGFWQRRFGGDPGVIGQSITLNSENYEIVGVMPAGFHFAKAGSPDVWRPLQPLPFQVRRRNLFWLNVIGRLKPGASMGQAQQELATIVGNIERQYSQSHTGEGIRLAALRDDIVGDVKPLLLVLLGAVAFVLLIACANVANLLLARAAARRKEIAFRMAIGASRARLVRQLLTESLLLSTMGGAVGLLIAQWIITALLAGIPAPLMLRMPYLATLSLDLKTLGFTFAIATLTGVLFGLAPALQSSKPDLTDALKEGRTSGGAIRARMRGLLVVSEIALAMMLLVGAGLMMKSFYRLLNVDPGFRTENLLTLKVGLPEDKYGDEARAAAFFKQVLTNLERLPGASGAATTDLLPLSGGGNTASFVVEGRPAPEPGAETEANVRTVSENYFSVMGLPLVAGRFFGEHDDGNAPSVLIINRTLAERLFPQQDAVGQRVVFGFDSQRRPWQIVGVVGDEKVKQLDARVTPVIYFNYAQDRGTYNAVVVRTSGDPAGLIAAARDEVHALEPEAAVFDEMPMAQLIAGSPSTFLRRYPALLIGAFAAVAVGLAMLGIYGVLSYAVTQRTHEIGIRMALGAQRRDVLRLIAGQSLRFAAAGIAVGVVGALALTRLMASLLYGVSASDPLTFTATAAALAVMALAAGFVPAHRATRVDPMIALRYE
ncbi:MAG TPA: ABC transporter permease [Blastocatellia bacterium]|nr:ABC transporter permease [Blastocatellia bacterium]